MDFLNLSRLNALVNTISGNMLPMTSERTNLSVALKVYRLTVWTMQLSYLAVCVLGIRYVPTENSLKDSTVAMAVTLETIVLGIYMNSRGKLLRKLIEQLNETLRNGDETLRSITTEKVKPLEKVLKMYTIGTIGSVNIWTLLQFITAIGKDEFYYVDYRVPAVFSPQPFSIGVFLAGGMFVCFGSTYAIARKISLDLYMIHMVRLMTAQYKYLRIRFAMILRRDSKSPKDEIWRGASWKEERVVEREMRVLTRHYESIIK